MTAEQPEWYRLSRAYSHALIALAPLVLLYWAFPPGRGLQEIQATINVTAPFYFIAVLLVLANNVLKVSSQLIWTGVLWFPIQSAIFFGFGPLVQVFGNETTQRYLSAHPLSADTTDLFRANTLSVTAITLVLLGFWLHMKMRRGAWQDTKTSRLASIPLLQLALALILVFGALKYLVINPSRWSANPTIIAGSIGQLAGMADVGFGILAYLSGKGNRTARSLFWTLWPAQLILCTLSFSKFEIVWAMIIPLMSNFMARRNRLRLVAGLAVIGLTFSLAQPYVHYGRSVTFEQTGSIDEADYAERLEISKKYLSQDNQANSNTFNSRDDRQGWWTRLSYAGVQGHAMRLHDSGITNPSNNEAWMFFIPRFIWPDKPNLSLSAVDFYRLATGNEGGNSFLGITYYGDLYWQYGWWGIFIGAPLIGMLFASMAARSFYSMKQQEFLMMPAILIALELSLLGPTGAVLTGVVGSSVIYFVYLFLLRVFEKWLPAVGPVNSARRVLQGNNRKQRDG